MTDILGDLFGGSKPAPAPSAPSSAVRNSSPARPGPVDPFAGDDNYGMKAITEMAHEMRSAVEGGRDKLLNNLCLKAGGIIRDGHLTRETAELYLREAAMEVSDASFDEWQIDEKLDRVIEEGINSDYQRVPREDLLFAEDVASGTPTEQVLENAHRRMVETELRVLRARDEAKTLFTAEKAGRTFREPPSVLTLREQLLLPREPITFSIEDLLPRGGNALLTAAFKAGKTTLVTALLRAYADAQPFLGRYTLHPHAGRIAVFNYELSQQQYDTWLEQSGIINTERVAVLHLRGYRLDLRSPSVEDWIVQWLIDHDVSTWIADPFARAAVGVDENSNTEVGVWLDTFDVIKERAGVIDGVLSTHTGRGEMEAGQERARGATRLDDWADVRWILTKDDEGNRFFRATGRDVEVGEEKLTFDQETRALTIGGGDRRWVKRRAIEDAVVTFVRDHPGSSGSSVERGVEGKAEGIRSALRSAVADHRLRVEEGDKNARLYFANGI